MVNATGWAELYNGNLIVASYTMYNYFLNGWTIGILFVVYQLMLIMKTRNLTLAFVTGLMFASMYGVSFINKTISNQVMFVVLVFELAGILYMLIWK